MALPNELVSQLVKIVGSRGSDNQDYTVYGTIVDVGDQQYVRLDGSDINTPFESTVEVTNDDRVMVEVKDHTATVTGNTTNPSIGTKTANGFRSSIEQNANDIKLAVEEIGKTNTAIELLPDQIKSTVKADYIDPINGKVDEFSEFKQTVEGFTFTTAGGTVKIGDGNLNLDGAISFDMLSDHTSVNTRITDATNTAKSAANDASDALDVASDAADDASSALATANSTDSTLTKLLSSDDTTTYIDGKKILTDSIYANRMHLGGSLAVYTALMGTTPGGYLGYDKGFNSEYGIGIRDASGNHQVVCTEKAARISYQASESVVCQSTTNGNAGVTIKSSNEIIFQVAGSSRSFTMYENAFYPYPSNVYMLGNANYKWKDVYSHSATINTSDRNEKNSIEDLPEKYIAMFDKLTPRRFKMNDGTSGRYHVGYIAQEVETAMLEVGIDSIEFGGFVKDKDENGNDIYMLRYGEFDGVRDAKIKQLETKLDEAYSIIDELKTRLDKLEAKEVG